MKNELFENQTVTYIAGNSNPECGSGNGDANIKDEGFKLPTFQDVLQDIRMEQFYHIIDNLDYLTWNNEKVLITSQVAQIFGISSNTLLNRFYKFKDSFEYGKDFCMLDGEDLKELGKLYNENGSVKYMTSVYIWTKSGVLLIAIILENKKYLNLSNHNKYLDIYRYLSYKYFGKGIECNPDNMEKDEKNAGKHGFKGTSTPYINGIHITNDSIKTPIEIALGIDENGMTTARKLYEFLEMDESHYSRWVKTNIIENPFAEENVDYFYSPSMASEHKRGNFAQNFKLSANFAKKLSMQGKTERAEQAREYFIRVEDKLKEVVVNNDSILKKQKQYQTDKVKHYISSTVFTSSTPIPKIKDSLGTAEFRKSNDWFYDNNNKIENILDSFGWDRKYLYHIILKTIGQEYDLQAARRIYKEELGIPVEYAMDIVEYFDVLSEAATKILNKLFNGVTNIN